jgi:ubiquinone/menaquinone biosynthesis C-methylase UbiE
LGIHVGIDPAERPLRLARQRGITVVQGVGESLPFRNASFGAVLFVVTLCFVQEPLAVLREAHRVLRDDGVLVVGMVFADSLWANFIGKRGRRDIPFTKRRAF